MNWVEEWFQKAKKVIFSPAQFYEEVEEREGYSYLIKFAVTSAIIASLLSTLLSSFIEVSILGGALASLPAALLAAVVSGALGGVLALFLGAAIIHIFVYFLDSGDYHDTLEAVTYPTAVNAFFGWIPLLNLVAWVYTLYLEIKGVERFQNLSTKKAALAVLLPVAIFGILLIIIIGGIMYYYGAFSPAELQSMTTPTSNFLL